MNTVSLLPRNNNMDYMKKRVSLLLSFTLACIAAMRAESCLMLQMRSGQLYSYVLNQQPVMTFGEGTVTMKSAGAEATFELTDIDNFHFTDTESGIRAVSNVETRFTYLNGIVTVEGSEGHAVMTDLAGRLLNGKINGHTCSFDLNHQPQGTYLLWMGQQSIKLYHK